jgi:hypothetical protein
VAPMPLRQLLEAANKGVLYSNTFSKDQNTALQDGGPSIPSSISQIDIRSNLLSDARKTIHALVMKSAHRSPASDCPPGFVHQQQDLEISSPCPDMPPGFDVVSVLCMLKISDY